MAKDIWHEKHNRIHSVSFKRMFRKLIALLSIEIVLGVFAGYLMFKFFGLGELLKTVLSWVIGMTLVAAFITTFMRIYHSK